MTKLLRFLRCTLKVGCIGFGGGNALVPLLERELIGQGKLDTKENFDKDVLIANLTPGALPVELAGSLGWRNFGAVGMLLGTMAMALPGALATVLLLTCLDGLRTRVGLVMNVLTVLISAYIIVLILRYIRKVCRECRKFTPLFVRRAILVMIGVFVLSCGNNLYSLLGISGKPVVCFSTLHILLVSFAGIFLINVVRGLRERAEGKKTTLAPPAAEVEKPYDLRVWCVFLFVLALPVLLLGHALPKYLLFLGRGCVSTLLSFGGGDAYLAVADGLFVEAGIVSSSAFYGDIVPVANILPGSILCKALTAIGYYYGLSATGSTLGALVFALGGFAVSVSVSCMVFRIVYYLYEHLSNFRSMQTISHYIGPIICGLLGTVILALLSVVSGAVTALISLMQT
jgi:chromate transporter